VIHFYGSACDWWRSTVTGETLNEAAWKDEERGKEILMDLIYWLIAFFSPTGIRRLYAQSRTIQMNIPLAVQTAAPAVILNGGRLSRGPTASIRRLDL
jgi:hypothetical protein